MKKALTLLLVILVCTAPAVAQEDTDEEDGSTINIDLGEVVEAIEDLATDFSDFTDSWDDALKELIKTTIFGPFLSLLKYLISILATVLLHTSDVHPNPAVEEIHQQTLLVTYLCAGLAFMIAGLLHMIGPILGVSYRQVRMILPRLVAALVFASVSLPLLQYMIEFSNALVYAFKPRGLVTSLGEMFGTASVLVLVWVVNSWLLLAVVLLFIVRSAYILFVAAISPLLALGWSLPKVKRYADSFIAGWFTALMMAPLDMIVLKFMFELMSGQGATIAQSVSNWVFGMASAVLLIWIPYQLYGASQSAIGQAYSITGQVRTRWQKRKRTKRRENRRQRRMRHRQEQLKQMQNRGRNTPQHRGGD